MWKNEVFDFEAFAAVKISNENLITIIFNLIFD